jgi:hypothetical protein
MSFYLSVAGACQRISVFVFVFVFLFSFCEFVLLWLWLFVYRVISLFCFLKLMECFVPNSGYFNFTTHVHALVLSPIEIIIDVKSELHIIVADVCGRHRTAFLNLFYEGVPTGRAERAHSITYTFLHYNGDTSRSI